ncbi:MAG: glycosyltransferase [Acidimicrobiales bacterium]
MDIATRAPKATIDVEVAVPVYNEVAGLEASVRRLRNYLDERVPYRTLITIADNASTDGTTELARRLAVEIPGVRLVHLDEKGRGRALRSVWNSSEARVVAYMDVDLSTDLNAFLPLVAPLLSGHSDLATGSRLQRSSRVVRGPKRELISRCYNQILRTTLQVRFRDAQCGFKAVRADVVRQLMAEVEDQEWFFDTELLVRAERAGLRIHEVAVDWIDDPDSRVHVTRTAVDDLRGVARLVCDICVGEASVARNRSDQADGLAARFVGVDAAVTLVHLALFLALRPLLGVLPANAMVFALLTGFCLRHTRHGRPRARAATVLAGAAGLTTLALAASTALGVTSMFEVTMVLVGAGLVAALVRFVCAHAWAMADQVRTTEPAPASAGLSADPANALAA